MKKTIKLILLLSLIPSLCFGGVIFQDNFDSDTDWPATCTYGIDPIPNGWTDSSNLSSSTYDSVTHCRIELNSPGRGGTGKSLKVWRQGATWIGEFSVLSYTLPLTTYRELYTRWYMKIPSDFDTVGATNYFKFWRYDHGPNGGDQDTTCFNWNADTTLSADGKFAILSSAWAAWTTVLTNVQVPRDDQWYCHELRIKLNSIGIRRTDISFESGTKHIHTVAGDFSATGFISGQIIYVKGGGANEYSSLTISSVDSSTQMTVSEAISDSASGSQVTLSVKDGIIQYWLDGVSKVNVTNVTFNAIASDYFINASFGNGNTAATSFQTPWSALDYDDYVVSTGYIGTLEEGSSAMTFGTGAAPTLGTGAGMTLQ